MQTKMSGKGALNIQVTWDHAALKRVDRNLAQYQGMPLEKRVSLAMQKAIRPLGAKLKSAERGSGIQNRSGLHLRSIKVRKSRKRPGEIAAYTAGPTDYKRHWLVRGHRAVTHRPDRRDTGFRSRAFPYVEPVIVRETPEIMGKLGTDVWGNR